MKKDIYNNINRKVIGVLGLSPYATIDFLRKLADATPAKKDWEHIRVLIDINTKIPSRGRALELGEENPTPYIRKAIKDLYKNGADFIVIPCNTSHYYYHEVIKGFGIPILNIMEETSNYILSHYPKLIKVGLMASRSTIKYKLYDRFLIPRGVTVLTLPGEQDIVSDIIEDIKVGNDGFETKERAKQIAEKLIKIGAEGIILGCTEISLVLNDDDLTVPIFDSNNILAKICVKKACKM